MERMEPVTIYAAFGTDQVQHSTIQTTKCWTADLSPPSNQTITTGCDRPEVPLSFKVKLLIQIRFLMLFLPENVRASLRRLRNRQES
jgi:hypothetical protein